MVNYSTKSGVLGLKQIWKSLRTRGCEDTEANKIFDRHTQHFLNRCFCDWVKGENRYEDK